MTKHGFLAIVSAFAAGSLFGFCGAGWANTPANHRMVAQVKGAHAGKDTAGPQPAAASEGKLSGPAKSASGSANAKANAKLQYDGPPVLAPDSFSGMAAVGYASAKAAPEVMSKLFCYCGCDVTDNHSRLIDCFTSPHGVDCHICQEEAVLALKLYRQGVAIAEIQRQVDQTYSNKYPFQEKTEAIKKYEASRLWTSGSNPTAQTAADSTTSEHKDAAGPMPDGDAYVKPGTKSEIKPKVKPGFHVGNCCGGEEHK